MGPPLMILLQAPFLLDPSLAICWVSYLQFVTISTKATVQWDLSKIVFSGSSDIQILQEQAP